MGRARARAASIAKKEKPRYIKTRIIKNKNKNESRIKKSRTKTRTEKKVGGEGRGAFFFRHLTRYLLRYHGAQGTFVALQGTLAELPSRYLKAEVPCKVPCSSRYLLMYLTRYLVRYLGAQGTLKVPCIAVCCISERSKGCGALRSGRCVGSNRCVGSLITFLMG